MRFPPFTFFLLASLVIVTAQADQRCRKNLEESTPTARFVFDDNGTVIDKQRLSGCVAPWVKNGMAKPVLGERVNIAGKKPWMLSQNSIAIPSENQARGGYRLFRNWPLL